MKQKLLAALAIILFAVGFFRIYRVLNPPPTPMALGLYDYSGQAISQKVLTSNKGSRHIILWHPQLSPTSDPLDVTLETFRQSFLKEPGNTITAEEMDPYKRRGPCPDLTAYPVTAERVRELQQKYPQADLLVIFSGKPKFPPPAAAGTLPKVFVVTLIGMRLDAEIYTNPQFAGSLEPSNKPWIAQSVPGRFTDVEIFEHTFQFFPPGIAPPDAPTKDDDALKGTTQKMRPK